MSIRRFQPLAGFLRPYRQTVLALMALTALLTALAMLPPLFVRAVINDVIVDGDRSRLPLIALLMIVVPMVNALCGYLQILGVSSVAQRVILALRAGLFEHLLTLSMRFYGKHSVGKLTNRLLGDTAVLQQILSLATVQIMTDFVTALFAVSVTFVLNWRLALVLVATVVLLAVNYRLNVNRIRRATRSYRGEEDRMAGGVQNRLVANLTVVTFGAEQREHETFRNQSAATLGYVQQGEQASSTFTMNTMLLRDMGRITIYFLGCAMVLGGTASYGDVVAFTAYAMQLLLPAVRFSGLARQFQDAGVSIDRLGELFEDAPEVESPRQPRLPVSARGAVDFEQITFGYDPGRPVLRDFDLHVRPGESIALVGPTGCGKSTILSLLMRFFDPQRGVIRLDGVDVRDLDLQWLRRRFGIVLQESLLFNVSVAENIAYSRPNATPAEIEQAARLAEIYDTVRALPHGFQSQIGHRDIQLSVGQKQRIAIARAVLADPAILIMDEATSALDSESEQAIQRAIARFLQNRTAFIVAHRLSTIRNADRIVVMAAGRIREIGSHDELMSLPGGRYRTLYLRHSGKGSLADDEAGDAESGEEDAPHA